MARKLNQKLKLMILLDLLYEYTDDEHDICMNQILDYMEKQEIPVTRKTVYDDIEILQQYGIDIIKSNRDNRVWFSIGKRDFELAELKLLVDAVQSSKFITEKKSRHLIKKLMKLTSKHEAEELKRQVIVQGRIKSMNESILYVIDRLNRAIVNNSIITFLYMKWNSKKQLVLKKNERYEVSPWNMVWDSENYYLIAYDSSAQKIKHYRVDKMKDIQITGRKREGLSAYKSLDMSSYTRKTFSMFSGDNERVSMRFKKEIVGVIIDRFGKDIMILPSSIDGWYETKVDVSVSSQFFGWIFGLGEDIKITGPEKAIVGYKEQLNRILDINR